MAKLILINGKKRSGKDYFASMLQEELYKVKKTSEVMSFAGPIKEIISETLDISLSDLDKWKNDAESIIVRDNGHQKIISNFRLILQKFGTEAMKKHFGEDVWQKLLIEKASKSNVDYVIVPDFRFLCEDVPGSITIKIRNDEIEKNSTDNHRSENELNDFKFMYTIDNSDYKATTKDVQDFIKFAFIKQAAEELN